MSSKNFWVRYTLSALFSCIGIVLQLFLSPHFNLVPFILALPIIFIISTIWGFGPAFLNIVIWSYGLSYYHFDPLYSVRIGDGAEMFHLILFLVTATGVSWMVDRSKNIERKQNIIEAENRIRNTQIC